MTKEINDDEKTNYALEEKEVSQRVDITYDNVINIGQPEELDASEKPVISQLEIPRQDTQEIKTTEHHESHINGALFTNLLEIPYKHDNELLLLTQTETTQTIIQKPHIIIRPETYFYLANGFILKSIEELYHALSIMDDSLFEQHANQTKNDFANWIRDVFTETELANKISKTKSKIETQNILKEYLNEK